MASFHKLPAHTLAPVAVTLILAGHAAVGAPAIGSGPVSYVSHCSYRGPAQRCLSEHLFTIPYAGPAVPAHAAVAEFNASEGRRAEFDASRLRAGGQAFAFAITIGGAAFDRAHAVATDRQGNIYVAGETSSLSFPGTKERPNATDAFLLKLDATARTILYAVTLGGSSSESARAVAVDSEGNAYVVGVTTSLDFPTTPGVWQARTGSPGLEDAFAAKIDPAGRLVYSTYVGGANTDLAWGVAVDGRGFVYLAGSSNSESFPGIAGTARQRFAGASDCLVVGLNASASALVYGSWLGGEDIDVCTAIAATPDGQVFLAGSTMSKRFPVAAAEKDTLSGAQDAFVVKLDAAGRTVFATYLGGESSDQASAVAVDASGAIYVGGAAASEELPLTEGTLQPFVAGSYDGFVCRLNPLGAVAFCSYVGGSGSDTVAAIRVSNTGYIAVAGTTMSSDFPVVSPSQASFGGQIDAFAAVLAPDAASVVYASYLGGSGDDRAAGVDFADDGAVVFAGSAAAGSALLTSPFGTTPAGQNDAFVASAKLPPFHVRVIAPAENQSVGGALVLQGTASHPSGVIQAMEFLIDGVAACSDATPKASGSRFECSWNSASRVNGPHLIMAKAYDGAGLNTESASVRFVIQNINQAPKVAGVAPISGAAASVSFTATYSDANGSADLALTYLLVNSVLDGTRACLLQYSRASNEFRLLNDEGTKMLGPVTAGSQTPLSNSQCALNFTDVSRGAETLQTTLGLSFSAAFAGAKNVYAYAADTAGLASGWVQTGTFAAAPRRAPVVAGVSPTGGAGTSQTFTVEYRDGNGALDIASAYLLLNSALDGTRACMVRYDRAPNRFWLLNDLGAAMLGPVSPGGGTLSNEQCTLGPALSVATDTTGLKIDFPLSFKAAFAGARNLYVYVDDTSGVNSGWVLGGSYSVAPPAPVSPTIKTLAPGAASGSTQTWSATFSDANGAADIAVAYLLVNTDVNGIRACMVQYVRPANQFWLLNDAGDRMLGPITAGSGSLSNSQCTLDGRTAAGVAAGQDLSVTVPLTFTSGFTGTKNVYLYVGDAGGRAAGWTKTGNYNVSAPSASPPRAVGIAPDNGAGLSHTFTATYADPNGGGNIAVSYVLFNYALDGTAACMVQYNRAANQLWLLNDAGAALLGPMTPGSGSLSNGQCTLQGRGAAAAISGNELKLTLPLSFSTAFAGTKNVFMYAADEGGLGSGWVQPGTYTVPSKAPMVTGVSPVTASGSSQTFTATYSDTDGGGDVAVVYLLVNSQLDATRGCLIQFNRVTNEFRLANDEGTALLGPLASVNGRVLSNRQCTLSQAGAVAMVEGNELRISFPLSFTEAFAGPKKVFLHAADSSGLVSNWRQAGEFTVATTR